jgi:hypothetical protein
VTPPTEGHEAIQVEVRATLGTLHQVVNVQSAPNAAGLAAPSGSREDFVSDGCPVGPTRRSAPDRSRSARVHPATCARPDWSPPPQHADSQFCPPGQNSLASRTTSSSPRSR